MDKRVDFIPGGFYHVFNRSNNGERIFLDSESKGQLMASIDKYISPHVTIISHCILNNHFHYVMRINDLDKDYVEYLNQNKKKSKFVQYFLEEETDKNFSRMISGQFQRCFISLCTVLNLKQSRYGNVLQHRFKHTWIEKHRVPDVIAYVHNNPRHHRYVADPRNYVYCSLSDSRSKNWQSYFMGPIGMKYHDALMDLVQARKTETLDQIPGSTLAIIQDYHMWLDTGKQMLIQ